MRLLRNYKPSFQWGKIMKLGKLALIFALFGATVASSAAWADHGHYRGHSGVRFGVVIGSPWGWPYYQPGPYYYPERYYSEGPYYRPYYPPQVVVQPAPVYVERTDLSVAPPAQNYWYYCAAAKGYYPYVRECPGGWQPVAPQPSAPR